MVVFLIFLKASRVHPSDKSLVHWVAPLQEYMSGFLPKLRSEGLVSMSPVVFDKSVLRGQQMMVILAGDGAIAKVVPVPDGGRVGEPSLMLSDDLHGRSGMEMGESSHLCIIINVNGIVDGMTRRIKGKGFPSASGNQLMVVMLFIRRRSIPWRWSVEWN